MFVATRGKVDRPPFDMQSRALKPLLVVQRGSHSPKGCTFAATVGASVAEMFPCFYKAVYYVCMHVQNVLFYRPVQYYQAKGKTPKVKVKIGPYP